MAETIVPVSEKDRLRLYDADGDGNLDTIERTIMKYDTNGDGNFSIAEVKAIIVDLKSAEKEAKNMKRLAIIACAVSLAFMGVMLSLMIIAAEVSKDTRPESNGVVKDTDGNVIAVGTETQDGQAWNNRAQTLAGMIDTGGAISLWMRACAT